MTIEYHQSLVQYLCYSGDFLDILNFNGYYIRKTDAIGGMYKMKYYLFKHSHEENLKYAKHLEKLSDIFLWGLGTPCFLLVMGLGISFIVDIVLHDVINHQVEVALYVSYAVLVCFCLISHFLDIYRSWYLRADKFDREFFILLRSQWKNVKEHADEYTNDFYKRMISEFGTTDDVGDDLLDKLRKSGKETEVLNFRFVRKYMRKKANEGYVYALYLYGLTVGNKKKAIDYFRKASDKDWLPATYQIGKCYYYGYGVKQDYRKSAEYFKKCVEVEATCYESETFAKLDLADQYFCGLGVPRDIEKADAMYREIVEHKEWGWGNANSRLERSEIPCPKCGCESYPYKDGKFKCEGFKHTFELPEEAKPKKKEEMTAVEINQICSKGFMIVHAADSDIGKEGSAFLIAEEGYALTNAHVILNDRNNKPFKSIYVEFFEERIEVKVVAYAIEHGDDMALLKLDHVPFEAKAMSFGDSDILQVGETVYAIGNPCGIGVSFVNGSINKIGVMVYGRNNAILTNCSGINHGNSGGPLLNRFGKVIGMNTWSRSCTSDGQPVTGLHYAIPSNDLVEFINDKLDNMGVEKTAYRVKTGRRKIFK